MPASAPPEDRTDDSTRRRAITRRRSKVRSLVPAGRATTACATNGRDAAADAPSALRSNGTVRQPTIGRPASAWIRSMSRRAAVRPVRPRGRNAITIPGRSVAPAEMRSSMDGDSGSATPAPSLDSPSAPNAPRCARAASPLSATGRTRRPLRPPASATNPTPHASCSNRGSYSGARASRRSVASIVMASPRGGGAAAARMGRGRTVG